MPYSGLNEFITTLENKGELLRVKSFVDPVLEITEITDRITKQKERGKALLFENTGTNFPLLINALGSEKRITLAFQTHQLDDLGKEIEAIFKTITSPQNNLWGKLKMLPKLKEFSSWMPKSIKGKGRCQEIIHTEPDLNNLPVLQCWPFDGGRFITLPIVHTVDPDTGIRNIGMYRMQIFSKNLTGMHWHKHKVGARHYNEYKKKKQKMPVAVALGGDPVYTYAATAPMPDNMDEYLLAGFLRKKRVELVKAITQNIEVPADADIVIEGFIDPLEDKIWEGPFGDHTGFYSLPDWYPRFHVTCITHRKDAVYPATIVGIPPQEDASLAKATERIFLTPIKLTISPEILDMDMPPEGTAHNLAMVKINKTYAGQALKVANALWGAGQMMFNKILIVTDKDVNIHNYQQVARAITHNTDPQMDIHFMRGPLDILDHSASKFAYGSKMCIDATHKTPEEMRATEKTGQNVFSITIPEKKIITNFNEIKSINTRALSNGISLIIFGVNKQNDVSISALAKNLLDINEIKQIKFLLFIDADVPLNDLSSVLWITTNNIDPERDCFIFKATKNSEISQTLIDATQKTKQNDNFERKWPNIIVSADKTIGKIDKNWEKLGLGEFIPSPSLKYKKMIKNSGAIVHPSRKKNNFE